MIKCCFVEYCRPPRSLIPILSYLVAMFQTEQNNNFSLLWRNKSHNLSTKKLMSYTIVSQSLNELWLTLCWPTFAPVGPFTGHIVSQRLKQTFYTTRGATRPESTHLLIWSWPVDHCLTLQVLAICHHRRSSCAADHPVKVWTTCLITDDTKCCRLQVEEDYRPTVLYYSLQYYILHLRDTGKSTSKNQEL